MDAERLQNQLSNIKKLYSRFVTVANEIKNLHNEIKTSLGEESVNGAGSNICENAYENVSRDVSYTKEVNVDLGTINVTSGYPDVVSICNDIIHENHVHNSSLTKRSSVYSNTILREPSSVEYNINGSDVGSSNKQFSVVDGEYTNGKEVSINANFKPSAVGSALGSSNGNQFSIINEEHTSASACSNVKDKPIKNDNWMMGVKLQNCQTFADKQLEMVTNKDVHNSNVSKSSSVYPNTILREPSSVKCNDVKSSDVGSNLGSSNVDQFSIIDEEYTNGIACSNVKVKPSDNDNWVMGIKLPNYTIFADEQLEMVTNKHVHNSSLTKRSSVYSNTILREPSSVEYNINGSDVGSSNKQFSVVDGEYTNGKEVSINANFKPSAVGSALGSSNGNQFSIINEEHTSASACSNVKDKPIKNDNWMMGVKLQNCQTFADKQLEMVTNKDVHNSNVSKSSSVYPNTILREPSSVKCNDVKSSDVGSNLGSSNVDQFSIIDEEYTNGIACSNVKVKPSDNDNWVMGIKLPNYTIFADEQLEMVTNKPTYLKNYLYYLYDDYSEAHDTFDRSQNSPGENISDVETGKVAGQMTRHNHAPHTESQFSSKDDGDDVTFTFANKIVETSIIDIVTHQECADNNANALECELVSSPVETELETMDCETFEIKRHRGCDNSKMFVPTSDAGVKKLCCVYCLKRYQKLERHLRTVHKNETKVKKFLAYAPRTKERSNIIAEIRNAGRLKWNSNLDLNNGELSTSRRPNKKFKNNPLRQKTCPNCKTTVILLSQHWKKCSKTFIDGERVVTELSRIVEGRIHHDASEDLNEVFASVQDNEYIRLARFDWLIVAYGNELCLNYSPHYQKTYIRAKLRATAKLLNTSRSISQHINDLSSLFHVRNCNIVVESIRIMGKFDLQSKLFKSPGTAATTVTLVNTVGELLITEYMKMDDQENEKNVERFLKLFQREAKTKILKLVTISKAKAQRGKKTNIPTTADVNKLATFLASERVKCFSELSQKFTYKNWVALSQLTLVTILLFNRRRAGEMQNITIEDFNCREMIADLCEDLPEEMLRDIKSRMQIRGKKNRTVPVLLKISYEECLDILIRHRKDARVPDNNEFLFALPSQIGRIRTVNVWTVIRSFAVACGAKNPSSLRGTNLRKHLASFCATKNLSDNDVTNIADFMGHHEKVHRDVYRNNPLFSQISKLPLLLNSAQGDESEDSSDSSLECSSDDDDDDEPDEVIAKTTRKTISSCKRNRVNNTKEVTTKTSTTRKSIGSCKRNPVKNLKCHENKTKKKVRTTDTNEKRKKSKDIKAIKKRKIN